MSQNGWENEFPMDKKYIRTGVIGVGYLGKYHTDKYASLDEAELVGVMDINSTRAQEVAKRYGCKAFSELSPLLEQIEAVSVVVPTVAHYEVAKACLKRGIHVLLEKPIATSLDEAEELIALAKEKDVILQIGHLERFNPAVMALFPQLKNPLFIESDRLSPFPERGTDVNVVLDLMVHDLDIILAAVPASLQEIRAVGVPVVSSNVDIANVRLEFKSGCVANLTASRISDKQMRKIRIFQEDTYFSLDYVKSELNIFKRKGISISKEHLSFPKGDPLKREIGAFLHAAKEEASPVVSGEEGLRVLEVALAINEQIKKRLKLKSLSVGQYKFIRKRSLQRT